MNKKILNSDEMGVKEVKKGTYEIKYSGDASIYTQEEKTMWNNIKKGLTAKDPSPKSTTRYLEIENITLLGNALKNLKAAGIKRVNNVSIGAFIKDNYTPMTNMYI